MKLTLAMAALACVFLAGCGHETKVEAPWRRLAKLSILTSLILLVLGVLLHYR